MAPPSEVAGRVLQVHRHAALQTEPVGSGHALAVMMGEAKPASPPWMEEEISCVAQSSVRGLLKHKDIRFL